MFKLIESTPVSLDGVIEAPERWASFDAEATEPLAWTPSLNEARLTGNHLHIPADTREEGGP